MSRESVYLFLDIDLNKIIETIQFEYDLNCPNCTNNIKLFIAIPGPKKEIKLDSTVTEMDDIGVSEPLFSKPVFDEISQSENVENIINTEEMLNVDLTDQEQDVCISKINDEENVLRCRYCERRCNSKTGLIKHEKNHLDARNRRMKFENFKHPNAHENMVHANTEYQCEKCNFVTQIRSIFENHRIQCDNPRPYKCDICGKDFPHRSRITEHMRRKHMKSKLFSCTICSKSFSRKCDLNVHVKHVHSEARFECEICKKKFKLLGNLSQHAKHVHSEPRFKCKKCEMKFKRLVELKSHEYNIHMKKHELNHLDDADKLFHCSFCDKAFARKGEHRNHEKSQFCLKSFICGLCKKYFKSLENLRFHIKHVCGAKENLK